MDTTNNKIIILKSKKQDHHTWYFVRIFKKNIPRKFKYHI